MIFWNYKSSHAEGFYRKCVLQNVVKTFTGKQLCQSFFFKVSIFFLKKKTQTQEFFSRQYFRKVFKRIFEDLK